MISRMLLGMKVLLALFSLTLGCFGMIPSDEYFKVDSIVSGLEDPMEIAVTPAGDLFVIERKGAVKLVDPETGKIRTVIQLKVQIREGSYARECGLLGITLDPNFAKNKWVYLYYSPKKKSRHQLSRFTFDGRTLKDEKIILKVPQDPENATCHEAGSLTFGPEGHLFIATGDNTCPFKSKGSTPIDERKERHWYDAQRTSGNTNDLRGKILRIIPQPDGSYTIPDGNLFTKGTIKTRPEIYVMGCRNPYRISVDQKNGYLYWGEIGPDAGKTDHRGPRGYDEINQARKAGHFGWPYHIGDNIAYAEYDFEKDQISRKFSAKAAQNKSPNNTGLKKLPPAQPAFWHYPRSSACAGPVYYHSDYPDSASKFPKVFDSCLIAYDWTSNWIRLIKMDQKGNIVWNKPWLSKHRFVHPNDMVLGHRGQLYLLEYGSKWYDGTDGKIKRITYTHSPQTVRVPKNDPRMAGLPLDHPGSSLISQSTCLACHMTKAKSIGPSYLQVAKKYRDADSATIEELSKKILSGGVGIWGEQPMPPHPQHNSEETQQMIEAILRVK